MGDKKQLHFKTNVQLKSIIGKDLINDDNIAILELVKNSFDADAKQVTVKYLNLKKNDDKTIDSFSNDTSRLIVQDNGLGMNLNDIQNKWLNIAYSGKKIIKTQHKRRMAGAKGIGRFSCDRLGKYLNLYSKTSKDGEYVKLTIDWKKFEIDDEDKEIQSIPLQFKYITTEELKDLGFEPFNQGVLLEIIKLRSTWAYSTFDKKKNINWDTEKLINPNQAFEDNDFGIYLDAPEFIDENEVLKDNDKFIGKVENRIFDKLDFKSTSIEVSTIDSGTNILTKLKDKGQTVFWINEKNPYYPDIKNVKATIYYLNPYAKAFFTRQTGIQSVNYGSVFLFINGFRISPYGEVGNDWLGLDRRKAQGHSRYIGLRETVGHIEIWDDENEFQIVTSREGVVKNESFQKLTNSEQNNSFFFKAFRRLERYVVDGLNWDSSVYDSKNKNDAKKLKEIETKIISGESTDGELKYRENDKIKQRRIYSTIHSIISAKSYEVNELYINENLITRKVEDERKKSEKEFEQLIEDFENKKIDSETLTRILQNKAKENKELEKEIKEFSKYSTDEATSKAILELHKHKKSIEKQTQLINQLQLQLKELEEEKAEADRLANQAKNEAAKIKKELLETKTQNLFLQSVKSQDFDEVVSFLHHIGIGAKNIDTELKLFVKKLRKGKDLPKEVLLKKLDSILFENRKIISISKFASKANFKLFTSSVEIDIVGYITEYVANVLGLVSSQDPKIIVERGIDDVFELEIKPIELNIIIDNLISNSRRAKASEIIISFYIKDNLLEISFKDNGIGISEDNQDKIFDLGYTTTSGSGIGLFHIKKIMNEMGGDININVDNKKFTEFIITIIKK
jgi:signal transduction histidine kinase